MVEVKQKVSGAFRTPLGAATFCAIPSYISTMRKYDHNIIDAIFAALPRNPFIPLRFNDADAYSARSVIRALALTKSGTSIPSVNHS